MYLARQDGTEARGGRTSMRSLRVACAVVIVERESELAIVVCLGVQLQLFGSEQGG